jgi:hypothetical protein
MKKTITLKSKGITQKHETASGFNDVNSGSDAHHEPDDQVIQNILNYSKALQVKHSNLLGHISNLNN